MPFCVMPPCTKMEKIKWIWWESFRENKQRSWDNRTYNVEKHQQVDIGKLKKATLAVVVDRIDLVVCETPHEKVATSH